MNLRKTLLMFLALILLTAATNLIVNAQTQNQDEKKTEKPKDDEDETDESPEAQKELAKQAKISVEEARKIALARVPGTVIESEMGKKNGKVVYEFEIKDKDKKSFDVFVDAKTGEIVGVEADDDDDGEDTTSQADNKGKWYKFWRIIPGLSKKID